MPKTCINALIVATIRPFVPTYFWYFNRADIFVVVCTIFNILHIIRLVWHSIYSRWSEISSRKDRIHFCLYNLMHTVLALLDPECDRRDEITVKKMLK